MNPPIAFLILMVVAVFLFYGGLNAEWNDEGSEK